MTLLKTIRRLTEYKKFKYLNLAGNCISKNYDFEFEDAIVEMIEANDKLKHLDIRATGDKLDIMNVINRIKNTKTALETLHFDSK